MLKFSSDNSLARRPIQLLLLVAVLLSISVELSSALYNSDVSISVHEDFAGESDSEGTADLEIDSEVDQFPSRNHQFIVDWHFNEIRLAIASDLGLSYAKSPLMQLDAPPPES